MNAGNTSCMSFIDSKLKRIPNRQTTLTNIPTIIEAIAPISVPQRKYRPPKMVGKKLAAKTDPANDDISTTPAGG